MASELSLREPRQRTSFRLGPEKSEPVHPHITIRERVEHLAESLSALSVTEDKYMGVKKDKQTEGSNNKDGNGDSEDEKEAEARQQRRYCLRSLMLQSTELDYKTFKEQCKD